VARRPRPSRSMYAVSRDASGARTPGRRPPRPMRLHRAGGGGNTSAASGRDCLSVLQLTWRRGRLAADCPDPLLGIDIPHEGSGDFTDARRGACFENDRVAAALVLVRRPCHERVGERGEGIPVRTSTARRFLTVDRLHSSVIHACTARSTAPFAWPNLNRDGHCLADWPSP
jgi:hypothetical protein